MIRKTRRYINGMYAGSNEVETIDEFTTYREAYKMLKEYSMAMPDFNLWLSQRSTNEWRESTK